MTQAEALQSFAGFQGKTQSASHIKPLHWYVASRLTLEGGFHPDDITPRPPFVVKEISAGVGDLKYDPDSAGGGEQSILGGLKTKNVDVVVNRTGLGPVMAVSCKGVTGAFRNLTNRMEETIGECTNLHITYPALVLGYFVLLRANRETETELDTAEQAGDDGPKLSPNDIALEPTGSPVSSIIRFHNALQEMTGRQGIRNDLSRYEAIGFGLVNMNSGSLGELLEQYPDADSKLRIRDFFEAMYRRYDERFVTSAPDLKKITRRWEWNEDSPAFDEIEPDYPLRLAD